MEHISKTKNKNTFTQREGEKWKGCQGAANFVSCPISLGMAFYQRITSLSPSQTEESVW